MNHKQKQNKDKAHKQKQNKDKAHKQKQNKDKAHKQKQNKGYCWSSFCALYIAHCCHVFLYCPFGFL
jgi:cytosine/uracil/thiamine/allantoin permease